ncbi:MAG: NAD(P)H-dependent oxidoreductase subunit E [Ignavibacteriales bacterium]|nr:NAD(P)H-dependent oxidoreductase subunit E [Ignavibacteriales bacterium]
MGETTKDNKFTVEYANCLGLCDMGPAMAINDQVFLQSLLPKKQLNFLER